jgi:hypothetical protein
MDAEGLEQEDAKGLEQVYADWMEPIDPERQNQ